MWEEIHRIGFIVQLPEGLIVPYLVLPMPSVLDLVIFIVSLVNYLLSDSGSVKSQVLNSLATGSYLVFFPCETGTLHTGRTTPWCLPGLWVQAKLSLFPTLWPLKVQPWKAFTVAASAQVLKTLMFLQGRELTWLGHEGSDGCVQ